MTKVFRKYAITWSQRITPRSHWGRQKSQITIQLSVNSFLIKKSKKKNSYVINTQQQLFNHQFFGHLRSEKVTQNSKMVLITWLWSVYFDIRTSITSNWTFLEVVDDEIRFNPLIYTLMYRYTRIHTLRRILKIVSKSLTFVIPNRCIWILKLIPFDLETFWTKQLLESFLQLTANFLWFVVNDS